MITSLHRRHTVEFEAQATVARGATGILNIEFGKSIHLLATEDTPQIYSIDSRTSSIVFKSTFPPPGRQVGQQDAAQKVVGLLTRYSSLHVE